MIASIVEGANTTGLMLYLTGPGRANEHTRPHLVAGDDVLMDRWGGWAELSQAQSFEIAHAVDRYMTAFDVHPTGSRRVFNQETGRRETIPGPVPNHVWHCSLSLHPDEGPLSDETWQKIAADFVEAMGLTGADGKAPCRWVAVRHGAAKNGGDHVHIVVNTVRGDGTKWSPYRDQVKAGKACNAIEHRYGLEVVEAREHARGARADTAADLRASARRGEAMTDRAKLEPRVRAAAVAATSEADFVARLHGLGVRVRPRFAKGRTDVVEGYSLALHAPAGERAQWYSGGKVARDLSLPRLRARWPDTPASAQRAVDAWRHAWSGDGGRPAGRPGHDLHARAAALRSYDRVLRGVDVTDPVALADATRDIAGLLAAQALACDGHERMVLDRASRAVGRHAQTRARPAAPSPVPAAIGLAAQALSVMVSDARTDSMMLAVEVLALVQSLTALYEQARQTETARVMLRDTAASFRLVHAAALPAPADEDALRRPATAASATGRRSSSPSSAPGTGPPGAASGTDGSPQVPARAAASARASSARPAAGGTGTSRSAAPAPPPADGPGDDELARAGMSRQRSDRIRSMLALAGGAGPPRPVRGGPSAAREPRPRPSQGPVRGRGRSR